MKFENKYVELVQAVLINGGERKARNGGTNALFGIQISAEDLCHGKIPILLGRKMHYRAVFGELAAFFNAPMHIRDFEKQGCNYWKKWADETGELRLDYGNAWLDFNGVNQIEAVLTSLKEDPGGRRHLISGWRPDHLATNSLPCCHYAYQWFVNGEYLEMLWIQRSVDLMIGLPSDVLLATAWNIIMAHLTGYKPGKLTFQLGDVHIYKEHQQGALQYLRQYGHSTEELPNYNFNASLTDYMDFTNNDIVISNYDPMPHIDFLLKE